MKKKINITVKAKGGKKVSKGPVSYSAAAKAVGYKSGGKMGKCKGGC